MYAYLFDERATQGAGAQFQPVADALAADYERDPQGAPVFCSCSQGESLGDVVVRLAALLGRRGDGVVLRVVGHGSPGVVELSGNNLTVGTAWVLSPLAGQVRRIELHSCCVVASVENTYFDHRRSGGSFMPGLSPLANGDRDLGSYFRGGGIPSDVARSIRTMRGVQLICAMAATVRCAVRGAILTQALDVRDWQFEGPTVTAFNGGSLFLDVPKRGEEDTRIFGDVAGTYIIP